MPADTISRSPRRIGPATGLAADLARRLDDTGRPIRVGLIGDQDLSLMILDKIKTQL